MRIHSNKTFVIAIAAITLVTVQASTVQAQFSPNKVAVVKAAVGDPGGLVPFTIDQFPSQLTHIATDNYSYRRSVPVGPAASSIDTRASISSVGLLEGALTASPEGRRMVMAGYRNTFLGDLPTSFSTASPRTFVELSSSGRILATPFNPGAPESDSSFTGGTVRAAAARDGSAYMIGSSSTPGNGGLRYLFPGGWAESSAIDNDTLKDFVSVRIVGTDLVAAYNTASGFTVASYGPLPTGPTTPTAILSVSGETIRDFWMASPTRIYVSKASGLSRYDFSAMWTETPLGSFPGSPLRMDGRAVNGGFELYVTTFATSNNALVRVLDTILTDSSTPMAYSGPLHSYRGVAITPDVLTAWVYENEDDDLLALHAIGKDGSITSSRVEARNQFYIADRREVADFDGDGYYDIAFKRDLPTNQLAIWLMDGINVKASRIYNVPTGFSNYWVIDVDGDGKSDLVFEYWDGLNTRVGVWIMDGLNVVSSKPLGIIPPNWYLDRVMSFTRDGRYQLLFRNGATDLFANWVLNGTTVESSRIYGVLPAGWDLIARIDFNADGIPDMLLQNQNNSEVAIWFLGPNGQIVARRVFIVAPNWVVGAAMNTFDDGRGVLLWYNTSTGLGRMFHMQSETNYTWFDFDGTPFADWIPVGAGDILGTGRDQVALVNINTGQFAMWGFRGYNLDFSKFVDVPNGWELNKPMMPPAPL